MLLFLSDFLVVMVCTLRCGGMGIFECGGGQEGCELVGGDAAADTGKASKIPSLAESMPRYVARYLQPQEVQQKHASHGPVGARA